MIAREQGPLIEHVSDTAFLVAHARAVETARSDALFSDPLAAVLAGDKGRAIAAAFPPMTAWQVSMRTLVIDSFLRQAWSDGVRLFVNLGAGLDTRPYRLELPPDARWVEADYPDVIAYKESRLEHEAPRCTLERVGVDLADAGARRSFLDRLGAGSQRTVVLTEGVVPYLDLAQAAALADDLRTLAGLEGWIVDYISPETHKYRDRRVGRQLAKAQFKFRPDDWFEFFASHGFKPRSVQYLADEAQRVGRPPPLPWTARFLMKLARVTKRSARPGGFRRFAGYVWLEPS